MSDISIQAIEAEVGAWIDANWDLEMSVGQWWDLVFEARYAHPMLAEHAYGRSWNRPQAMAVGRMFATRNVLGPPPGLGYMLAAPTIAEHGTQEQIDRYIPQILSGREAWCQLFSEPGAGSDLAGMAAKAERDGDEWHITGQKVWTSQGQSADLGMLVARTDPDQPKHRGLTYFALPMAQSGVDIRPLKEMTGHAFFNEVFMDNAVTTDAAMIGDRGDGWRVANTTLMHERASIGSGGHGAAAAFPGSIANQFDKPVSEFVSRSTKSKSSLRAMPGVGMANFDSYTEMARKMGVEHDPIVRQKLMGLYSRITLNRLNTLRGKEKKQRTGGEANIAKLHNSALHHQFREVGLAISGADGMLTAEASTVNPHVAIMTLFSPAPSIYGGTNEIQKNIIGERVLGLPKEPGPDKNTPFSQLPKNQ